MVSDFDDPGNAGGRNSSGGVYVGGEYTGQRAIGKIILNNASPAPRVNIGGTLRVYSIGSVTINGGRLTAGSIDLQGGKITLASGGGKVPSRISARTRDYLRRARQPREHEI